MATPLIPRDYEDQSQNETVAIVKALFSCLVSSSDEIYFGPTRPALQVFLNGLIVHYNDNEGLRGCEVFAMACGSSSPVFPSFDLEGVIIYHGFMGIVKPVLGEEVVKKAKETIMRRK